MTAVLRVLQAGPGVSVQDGGRAGYLSLGLSRGGAADALALAEGAALLKQGSDCAALEMAVMGGEFVASDGLWIALTGAPMAASIDGVALAWNASYWLPADTRLLIGASQRGTFGYLHVAGGFQTPCTLGARGAHLAAGIGRVVRAGDELPVDAQTSHSARVSETIDAEARFAGGELRLVASLQTDWFDPDELIRFEAIGFQRDARGNRMGVRLLPDGDGFHSEQGLSVLSEVIVPGDVQVTGDGALYVLLSECQTTGGYPRIGSVLPSDLPRVAQSPAGSAFRFRFVSIEEAIGIERQSQARRAALRQRVHPRIRDPHDIPDLLAYQLISGVTAGDDSPAME